MENTPNMLESLLDKAEDFGKTTLELVKLKTLNKISDVVSSFIPNTIIFILIVSFMIFLNLGLAFWLGEILGETYYGFFAVAGFYVLTGIILYLFRKRVKKSISDSIINQMLN